MTIQDEIARTAGKAFGQAEKEIDKAIKYAEEQAHLLVLKTQMKEEVKKVISDKKSEIDKIEEKLDNLNHALKLITERVSNTAEGKIADKAIENLTVIRNDVYNAQSLYRTAKDSCKVYTWF